jgi:hypothetical protein
VQAVEPAGRGAISELETLLARLESAIGAIERRCQTENLALAELRGQQAADRARLARIEGAASEAVAALDALIAETP